MPKDSLTVTDNRTGKTYELPIADGTIKAIDLRKIKTGRGRFRPDDLRSGLPQYRRLPQRHHLHRRRQGHPAVPRLSYRADRREGQLPRGRPTCCARASSPPGPSWTSGSTTSGTTPTSTPTSSSSWKASATTPTRWACCLGAVGALSTFYPDAKNIEDPANRYLQRVRLIAKVPTIAAFAFRHSRGLPYEFPRNDLGYIGNFVNMTFRSAASTSPTRCCSGRSRSC